MRDSVECYFQVLLCREISSAMEASHTEYFGASGMQVNDIETGSNDHI